MGRPRKPTALRVLEGNAGKRPLPQDEPRPPVGAEPPAWLSPAAREQWAAVAPRLTAMRVLTAPDAEALGVLCTHLATVALLSGEGQPIPASLSAELRQLFSQFGMTPAGRARVTATPEKPQSKLDKFIVTKF